MEYTITIKRKLIQDESLFEASVKEFPDLVSYGDTLEDVCHLILDIIETPESIFNNSYEE